MLLPSFNEGWSALCCESRVSSVNMYRVIMRFYELITLHVRDRKRPIGPCYYVYFTRPFPNRMKCWNVKNASLWCKLTFWLKTYLSCPKNLLFCPKTLFFGPKLNFLIQKLYFSIQKLNVLVQRESPSYSAWRWVIGRRQYICMYLRTASNLFVKKLNFLI